MSSMRGRSPQADTSRSDTSSTPRGLDRWISFHTLGTLAWIVILIFSVKGQHDLGRGWGYAVPLVAVAVLGPLFLRFLDRYESGDAPPPTWCMSGFGAAMGAVVAYIQATARDDWPLPGVLAAVASLAVAGAVASPWLVRRAYARSRTGSSNRRT